MAKLEPLEVEFDCPLCPLKLKYIYESLTSRKLQHGPNPEHTLILTNDVNPTDPIIHEYAGPWLEAIHGLVDTTQASS